MDDADVTQERMDREDEMRRRLRASVPPTPPVYYTSCIWCGDPTELGAKYCCKDCSVDAHKYNASLKRNGVRNG